MASRTLQVVISGDPKPLNRAFDKAGRDAEHFEGRMKKSLGAVTKGFALAGVAAAGGLAVGLKKSADAAIDAEASMAKVKKMVENAGFSWEKHEKQIDRVIQAQSRLSGLDDEELAESFGNMLRTTGNLNEAFRLNGLSADIARTKGLGLAQAQSLLARVYNGAFMGVKRLGIAIEPVTAAQDKLRESTKHATHEQTEAAKKTDALATRQQVLADLQQKFGGQAEAYGKTTAGALDRASVASENLGEIVGAKLTPLLAKGATALVGLIDKAGKLAGPIRTASGPVIDFGRKVAAGFKELTSGVGRALNGIGPDLVTIGKALRKFQGVVGDVVIWIARRILPRLTEAIEGIATVVKGVVRIVAGILSGDFRKAWDGVKTVVRGALKALVAVIRGLWDLLGDAMVALGKAMLRALGRGLQKLPGLIKGVFTDAIPKILELAVDIGKAIVDGIVKGIKSGAEKVGDAITGLFTGKSKGGTGLGGRFGPGTGEGIGRQIGAGFVPPLPTGGAFGGSLMGARTAMRPFAALGSRYGLTVSSGRRPGAITSSGNVSWHSSGEAIDMSGSGTGMLAYFRELRSKFGGRLAELIHTPGGVGIKNGRPFRYGGQVAADHYDHVHVAFDSGRPGIGDGIGQIRNLWTRAGGRSGASNMAAAIAMAESGGNPTASNRNRDGSIDRGLWQINSVHGRLSTFDRLGNARAAVSISSNGRNWNPWTVFKTGAYKRFLTSGGGGGGGGGRGGGSTTTVTSGTFGTQVRSPFTGTVDPRLVNPPKGVFRPPPEGGEGGGDGGPTEDPNQPLIDATNALTEAIDRQKEEAKAVRDELKRNNDFADSVIAVTGKEAVRALVDLASGQIFGRYNSRRASAGSGVLVRY